MVSNCYFYDESDKNMLIFSTRRCGKSGSETVYALLKSVFLVHFDSDFPEIEKTPNGKPYFPNRRDVHFSLSHTETHVLCALSDAPVGCDIEALSRKVSTRALTYFSTPDEQNLFDPLELWTLKESYVKFIGGTFATIRTLKFSRDDEKVILPDPLAIARTYTIDGCLATVCGYESPPGSIELI